MGAKENSFVSKSELEEIVKILEDMKDEERAARLLKELNDRSAVLGKLLTSLDPELSHDEWKKNCDIAKERVDEIIAEIKGQGAI